jgi:hypothetical protein
LIDERARDPRGSVQIGSTARQQNAQGIRGYRDVHRELAQPLAISLSVRSDAFGGAARKRRDLDTLKKWIEPSQPEPAG